MQEVLKMKFLLRLLILHLITTVYSSTHNKRGGGGGEKNKHYADYSTYHQTKMLATSHSTDTSNIRYRKGQHTTTMDNVSSNLYVMLGNPTISEEYMDTFHEQPQQLDDKALFGNHQQISTCQTVCACKWKGGKQTVECLDRLLQQIPDNIDPSTQVLDMSGNQLQTLLNAQFVRANLLNLQKLYLRNCRIEHIEPQTFKGLTNLVELDLSHNLLISIPSMALSFMSSLRDLTIASNRIQKVEPNAFAYTPALHKLDLSHCEIHHIAPLAFEGLDGLTLLRLNGNKLTELVPKTIETLSRLHGIELHDNPWMCDCRLREAKLWLMRKNIPYPVAPICAGGPERVIDQTFAELTIDDFACKPEILPTNHYEEATMGETASITCKATAIPAPTIYWYWNGRLITNNTAFSTHQRLHILEHGGFAKTSRLILTNAQEIESSDFFCIAENRAGSSEANFTLHVKMRAVGMASLGSGQIVGLSAALVMLILFVLIVVVFLLVRLKREPYNNSKTPNQMEVITSLNQQNMIINKTQPCNGINDLMVTTNGSSIDSKILADDVNHIEVDNVLAQNANPLQKPPRLTDNAYASNMLGNNFSTASCFITPIALAGNNPDLINDTKRFEDDELADFKVISSNLNKTLITDLAGLETNGDYKCADGRDSFYPSGLWEDLIEGTCSSSSAEGLLHRRYSDKTPIIDAKHLYDMHDACNSAENFSKTFPRTNFNHNLQSNNGSCNMNSQSTASTTTTNLSMSGSGIVIGGYPADYGLPAVCGAELQINNNLQINPLQKQLLGGTLSRPNPLNHSTLTSSIYASSSSSNSTAFKSRTLPRQKPNTNFDANSSRNSPIPNNICSSSASVNAKTIRVWQRGGIPVLPPVSAIKRALISTSRNSPDEGYQEDCGGTDV